MCQLIKNILTFAFAYLIYHENRIGPNGKIHSYTHTRSNIAHNEWLSLIYEIVHFMRVETIKKNWSRKRDRGTNERHEKILSSNILKFTWKNKLADVLHNSEQ